ncbi:hypothetical protein TNCV_4189551 [Trichonephila clavipes]|nr:hypothetical protein TNCV_4189551 [Trichonephila clavipes]
MLGYKRSHESGSGGAERKIQKGSDHRVPKRALSSNYKTNSNLLNLERKAEKREETVKPTTSGYNLRPRSGSEVNVGFSGARAHEVEKERSPDQP